MVCKLYIEAIFDNYESPPSKLGYGWTDLSLVQFGRCDAASEYSVRQSERYGGISYSNIKVAAHEVKGAHPPLLHFTYHDRSYISCPF